MPKIGPKLHAFIYAVIIEGIVLAFATGIRVGPCGAANSFSGFMLIFALIFHLPGLAIMAILYVPVSIFLPVTWQNSIISISMIAGNVAFLTYALYSIRTQRGRRILK
jgi:hypothetical protein